jgi:hypothetical protein
MPARLLELIEYCWQIREVSNLGVRLTSWFPRLQQSIDPHRSHPSGSGACDILTLMVAHMDDARWLNAQGVGSQPEYPWIRLPDIAGLCRYDQIERRCQAKSMQIGIAIGNQGHLPSASQCFEGNDRIVEEAHSVVPDTHEPLAKHIDAIASIGVSRARHGSLERQPTQALHGQSFVAVLLPNGFPVRKEIVQRGIVSINAEAPASHHLHRVIEGMAHRGFKVPQCAIAIKDDERDRHRLPSPRNDNGATELWSCGRQTCAFCSELCW